MRYLLTALTILVVFLAFFPAVGLDAEDFTPDKSQSRFAESLKASVPGVEGAEWKTHVDLWVQVSAADKNSARLTAGSVLERAGKELGQMFCVHIHNGDWEELTRMCGVY